MDDGGDRDRVREATDIVDLISEVTKIRKSGRSVMAICPFHEEKTPSMSVDQTRGLYHCFGCGEGGDVFSFVQKTQSLNFLESLDFLARRAGITLTRDPQEARRSGRRQEAVEALRQATLVYHERLKKAAEAGPARSYLRGRGYDVDVIDEWRIGFAGTDWDTLTRDLKSQGVSDTALIDAGLSRRGSRGVFDFFRGRLMFPIHDVRGDPVGFGGRLVDGVQPESVSNPSAKYVNSPDSSIYRKSNLLFGLDRARKSIISDGRAVIVEGYTDVIAMHLAGVGTAVATCGTALGDGHFDLLRRFTERVVLAFDSDEAGSKAAIRGDDLDAPFRLDLDLRMAVMPDGLDPADIVQAGRGSELKGAVDDSRPLLEYRIDQHVQRHDLNTADGKARALEAAVGLLRRVSHEVARQEYARFTARLLGVDFDLVTKAVATGVIEIPDRKRKSPEEPLDRFESEIMRAVLGGEAGELEVTADDFTDDRLRDVFISVYDGEQETEVSDIADERVRTLALSLLVDARPRPVVADLNMLLQVRRIDRQIIEIESRLAGLEQGSQTHSDALRELIGLQQAKRSFGQ